MRCAFRHVLEVPVKVPSHTILVSKWHYSSSSQGRDDGVTSKWRYCVSVFPWPGCPGGMSLHWWILHLISLGAAPGTRSPAVTDA